jgi:cytochrome c oxidase cbb3-type subunit 3
MNISLKGVFNPRPFAWIRGSILLLLVSVAGYHVADAAQTQTPQQATGSTQPTYFVQHPDHIQPGIPLQGTMASLTNPYEGDAQRAAEGAKLFIAYNCMDCHGADGAGAMGPSFQDGRWHFGGTAGEVFQSIYEGRPEGMPAWGARLPDDQIWRLVTYVRGLSKGKDVSTENFTGKTIARTGH